MPESFKDAQETLKRGLSVKGALEGVLQESEEITEIVIVALKGDYVNTTISYSSSLSALGCLEVAKSDILLSMQED